MMNKKMHFIYSFIATVLLAASPLFADSVMYDGLEYKDVMVNGYHDGSLSVTLKGGEKRFDLSKVQWISLEAAPDMAVAEKLRDDNPKAASANYQKAIRALDNRDLKLLAELRAVAPADADNQWMTAVVYFLDAYQASPTADVWKLRPTHMPKAGSTFLTDSAGLIESKLPNIKSEEAKKNLKTWQLELYTRASDPRADALARELSGVPAEPKKALLAPPTEEGLTAPIDAAIKAKDFGGALKQADAQMPGASDTLAIKLYQLKARAYEGQGNLDLAASALLRIASFYPSAPEAPAALLVAADLQKRGNHADEAKHLYKEIIDKYPDSPAAIRARGG